MSDYEEMYGEVRTCRGCGALIETRIDGLWWCSGCKAHGTENKFQKRKQVPGADDCESSATAGEGVRSAVSCRPGTPLFATALDSRIVKEAL